MDGGGAEPRHSGAPEGKAISAAAVKKQYLLINFRRLARLVKAGGVMFVVRRSSPCRTTLLRKIKKKQRLTGD